jgi:tetratricopeptide (TPR) repeat protein
LVAQESLAEAAAVFAKLIESALPDPRFHIAYGHCLQQLRHWEQSAVQFEHGLALKPSYAEADARLMLAESYAKAGNQAKALEQWRIIAKMPPSYPSYEAPINEAKALLNQHA